MHNTRPARITSPLISLSQGYVKLVPLGLLVGAIGIGMAFLFSAAASGGYRRFSFAYLTNFSFLLSISLGCLFFVIVQHLTKAAWGVTVRRIAEIFAMCTLPLAVLFLPILIPVVRGSTDLYPWNVANWAGDNSPLLQVKFDYLKWYWFAARWAAYFAIWGFFAWNFLGKSLKQDETGDTKLTLKMQASSTWMMIIFAATLVFASFDLEMSLSPLWFSTMFPVYFFAGGVLGGLAAMTLTALLLQRSGRITDEITVDQYHDLAKLMFGFTFFWGYIAFSQFLLIWYANIPEETFWYRFRFWDAAWAKASWALLIFHLIIPFLGLMARTVRRNKTYLLFATIYLLCIHWYDHFWIVMPQYGSGIHGEPIDGAGGFPFSWAIDFPCAIGMVGLYVALFAWIAGDRPLVPKQDPRLGESLNHVNP
jgi:hypothetical protein